MKSLLVGNGINIQFDNTNYSSPQIVLRILKNCTRNDFPSHIIIDDPYLLKNYLGLLFLEVREILADKYDSYTFGSAEKLALSAFKKKYKAVHETLRITDIGFEDYYLIHDLVCHKTGTKNPEQYYARESMKAAYLYSIYNDGKLNQLHKRYPSSFVEYLSAFDCVFTTNYDSNIELATGVNVYHIHGHFDQKSDVYTANSFRNHLPDAPIQNYVIDENFYYLYSNALSTHCGEYKEFQIKQSSQANKAIERMASAYTTDQKFREEVERWANDDNLLTANFGHGIKVKAANPDLHISDDYHFDALKSIEGSIEILGLSPWNDFHIFESIDSSAVSNCIYYYFNDYECYEIKNLLPTLSKNDQLKFVPANTLWEGFNETKS